MHDAVIIRTAVPSDVDRMAALLAQLFSVEADFDIDTRAQAQGLSMLLFDERAKVLVAEGGGEVVGMCTGQLVISTAEGGPSVLVEDVVVDATWRGRGLGGRLMRKMGEWAMRRGATRMQLLADCDNVPALAFYDRLGWERTQLVCLRRREA